MNLRKSCLPRGWYPQNPDEIDRFLSGFRDFDGAVPGSAAIAPHAGWFFSGKIAAKAAAALDRNADTVVVIGGHLPKGAPALFAMEDAVSTPAGNIAIDTEFRDALYHNINGKADLYPDNTVEVLLPMVRFFLPEASLVWLRLPADLSAFEAGKNIAAAAKDLGRNIAVLASADLTHYGPNYGFTPKGCGPQALQWVREVNDHGFIEAVVSGNPSAVLEKAEKDSSCCSAGAVAGAMGYSAAAGTPRLLEYGTSAESGNADALPDSFVGYAAFVWER